MKRLTGQQLIDKIATFDENLEATEAHIAEACGYKNEGTGRICLNAFHVERAKAYLPPVGVPEKSKRVQGPAKCVRVRKDRSIVVRLEDLIPVERGQEVQISVIRRKGIPQIILKPAA